jgi:hypothetical protein
VRGLFSGCFVKQQSPEQSSTASGESMAYTDSMARVPFFFFQDREHGVDEPASKELGYQVPKMVTFILVTPHGHKGDPLEFIADEFLERKTKEAKDGRYDPSWVQEFKTGLISHREGKEIPRHGTPLITWERILKTRRETLVRRFPTLEDLAAVPDSSLGDIGLDGRVIRDMAKADIQAKRDLSPVVKELADVKEENRRLQEQITKLANRFDSQDEDKPRRGRKPRELVEG